MTLHTVYLGYYQTKPTKFIKEHKYYKLDIETGKFVLKTAARLEGPLVVRIAVYDIYDRSCKAFAVSPTVLATDAHHYVPVFCRRSFNKHKNDPNFGVWFELPDTVPWSGFKYIPIKVTTRTYTNLILRRLEV